MHFTTSVLASTVVALATASSLSGQATYYGGNVAGGACSLSTYTLPSGIFGTALSDSNWDTSANCGSCVSITGPSGNSITAMIVDECPGCGTNHLDLFPDAFAALADPTTGVIDITWEYVDCPITTPLEVHNKEGVSAYWFSMQVVNSNQGVSSLEVSTDGGSIWQSTTRQAYNFFENSAGFGTTKVDVKLTSDSGDVVIVNNVDISSGASTTASSNFGSSGSASTVAAVVASSSSSSAAVASSPLAVPTSSLSAQVTATEAGVFQEVSSSTPDATTKYTTRSSTTTLYKTITVPKSTSTSTISANSTSSSSSYSLSSSSITTTSSVAALITSSAVANSSTALPSGYSISVLAITMCKPTVLYSVFPVPTLSSTSTPSPIGTGVSTYSANVTLPAATSTTVFTGAASSMQASVLLAALAGLLVLLI